VEQEEKAIAVLSQSTDRITSAVTLVEVRRAIRRAVFDQRISVKAQQIAFRKVDAFAERCTVIAMTPAVLQRASESFPVEPVRLPLPEQELLFSQTITG
jgi:hypothetical protein